MVLDCLERIHKTSVLSDIQYIGFRRQRVSEKQSGVIALVEAARYNCDCDCVTACGDEWDCNCVCDCDCDCNWDCPSFNDDCHSDCREFDPQDYDFCGDFEPGDSFNCADCGDDC